MIGYWSWAIVCLWLLLIVIGVVQLGLLHKIEPVLAEGRLNVVRATFEGLEVGAEPANFQAVDAEDRLVDRSSLLDRWTMLLFLESGCEPCERLAAELSESESFLHGSQLIVVELLGPPYLNLPSEVKVWRQISGSVSDAFAIFGTPYAFVLDGDGIVRGRLLPSSLGDLRKLEEESMSVKLSAHSKETER